ncbi:MAG: sensor histidine kinase, partial [Anaerolineae bacterium]
VLANQLDSAVKYTKSTGKVEVRGELVVDRYRLSVSDQRPVLPEALRDRIFEPAAQLEARDAGLPRGVTLGLTFARLAVEAHGGRIYVEPNEGAGNRFVVELPLRPV